MNDRNVYVVRVIYDTYIIISLTRRTPSAVFFSYIQTFIMHVSNHCSRRHRSDKLIRERVGKKT